MIKYRLKCKKCEAQFESWFASSKEFEKIKRMKLLSCHKCKSLNVEKSLMSPNVLSSKQTKEGFRNDKKNSMLRKKITEYQNFIKKNFNYVGDNFSYEARSIHYNKKKNKKGIYGNATQDEIKELREEGIETTVIPWIKDKDN